MPLSSYIFMDGIESFEENNTLQLLKKRSLKLDLHIFSGIYPHLPQFYYDPSGEQIATFVDYHTIAVFPLLHQNKIKVKCPGGKRTDETQILATKMNGHLLYTFHSDNSIKLWNLKNGQIVHQVHSKVEGYSDYQFHQRINQTQFLLKRVKGDKEVAPLSTVDTYKEVMKGISKAAEYTEAPPQQKNRKLRMMMSVALCEEAIPEAEEEQELEEVKEEEFEEGGSLEDMQVLSEKKKSIVLMKKYQQAVELSKQGSINTNITNNEILRTIYNINIMDLDHVDLYQYKIIEIVDTAEESSNIGSQSSGKHNQLIDLVDQENHSSENPLSTIKIKDILIFDAPGTHNQSNNFGLFSSEDMELFTFYYKDIFKNIQTLYYQIKPQYGYQKNKDPSSQKFKELKFICKAIPNTWLSTHSNDFRHYLKQNQSEQLEVTPFDHTIRNEFMHDQNYNIQNKVQPSPNNGRPVTLGIDELIEVNDKIRNLSACSPDTAPSFITKNKIAFMSPDNVILGYMIFPSEEEKQLVEVKLSNGGTQLRRRPKEFLNFAQCSFPGSTGEIAMDSLIYLDGYLIGENTMIMEVKPNSQRPNWTQQIVAPNYFNSFFQEQSCNENDIDDAAEMKYIQNHFKTKIELLDRMYTGYIFQSKEFNGHQQYQTSLYIVNTFNFLLWRSISLMKRSRLLVEELSKQQLQCLSFTQLPNGKTLLHALKRNPDSIAQLFNTVYDLNVDKEPFYIPILEDRNEANVLHSVLVPKNSQDQNLSKDSVKSQVALEILKNIADYPFDLFKIKIKTFVPALMEIDFLKFVQYMEHRIRQPSMLTQLNIAKVTPDAICIFTRDDLWDHDEDAIRKEIENRTTGDMKRVEICLLDLHLIHLSKSTDNGRYIINLLYDKLAESDSLQVFTYNSVKALIEVKWRYIQRRIVIFQLIPYVCFMICFIIYTTNDLEYYDTYMLEGKQKESATLRILLWIFVAYFTILEGRQAIISGLKAYFQSPWNYMDLSLFALIILAEAIQGRFELNDPNLIGDQNYLQYAQVVRTLYAFAAILMWVRFLYFFRIFRTTGYYIRMLFQVVLDIRYFIFIYVLTIIAFAHAWFIFLKNNSTGTPQHKMTDSIAYSYLISLANYDVTQFGDYYPEISWLFFVGATFFLQIVLMNLLISIVADTFANIKSNYNVIMYKDMLHMIIENRFLAVGALTSELNHKYLLMALPISTSDDKEERKPAIFRNDSQKAMMNVLENLEVTIKDQYLKQNESLKKIAAMSNFEDNESLILERLQMMEERQLKFLTQLAKSKGGDVPMPEQPVIPMQEPLYERPSKGNRRSKL